MSNKQHKWPLFCIGCLVIGLAMGYFIGNHNDTSALGERRVLSSGIQNHSAAPRHRGAPDHSAAPKRSTAARPEKRRSQTRQAEMTLLDVLHGPNDHRREYKLYAAIAEMSPAEIASAITLAQSLPKTERRSLLRMLAERWAETDPQAVMAWRDTITDRALRDDVTEIACMVWARSDSQAARAAALALPAGTARDRALARVAQALVAQHDPAAAVSLIAHLPFGEPRNEALHAVWKSSWAGDDPTAAAAYVSELDHPTTRSFALKSLAGSLARKDASAALAWINQFSEEEFSEEEKKRAEQQLVGIWAENDPRAAAEYWADFHAIEDVWAINERSASYEYWKESERSADPNSLDMVNSIVSKWAEIDAEQALAFAQQMENEYFRDRISENVLADMTESDPLRAIDLFHQIPPSNQGSTYQAIRSKWLKTDVAACAAWVSQLPEDMVSEADGGHIAGAWTRKDPVAAAEWLSELPDSPMRDDGVRVFASIMHSQYPDNAVDWANTISDAELRDIVIRDLLDGK
jgi:hypothetical protein